MKQARFAVSKEMIEKLIGLPEGSLMTIDTRVVNGKKRIWFVVEHDGLPDTTQVGASLEGIAECNPTFGLTVDDVPVVLAWNPRSPTPPADVFMPDSSSGATAKSTATKPKPTISNAGSA